MKNVLLAILAFGLGCQKLDPQCWKSEENRPERCREDWCRGRCTDAQAFKWLSQYDQCLARTTEEQMRKSPLYRGEGTVREYCYSWFLQYHQGITNDQVRRYRTLNGPPRSK